MKMYPIVCQKCGKTFEVKKYRKDKAKFCSYECSHVGQIYRGGEVLKKYMAEHGQWAKGKTKSNHPSLSRPKNGKNFGEPWAKGKSKDTDERLRALSKKNKVIIQQMYDDGKIDLTKRKIDYNIVSRKVSDTISRKLANGTLENQHRYIKGWYNRQDGTNEYYESSYELAYMKKLDATNVSWTKRHGIRIKYFDPIRNKERYYVPDFFVSRNEIHEIKPDRRCKEPTNVAKFAALWDYCLTHNYTFAIITESEINL